jgi:nicotinamidase-related amidase
MPVGRSPNWRPADALYLLQQWFEQMISHEGPFIDAGDVAVSDRIVDAALLIVDMQNDFVRAGAPLEVPEARQTILPIQSLMRAFRAKGRPVVFTRFLGGPQGGLMWLWSPQCRPDVKCCWQGVQRGYGDVSGVLDCTAIIRELTPGPDDLVVDKYGYGSFHATSLDRELRARGVRSLVIAGTVTQICVEETAREAFHHGYRTTMVSDAVSSFAPDLQAATLKNFAMKFGWVADAATVVQWLECA